MTQNCPVFEWQPSMMILPIYYHDSIMQVQVVMTILSRINTYYGETIWATMIIATLGPTERLLAKRPE